MSTPCFDTFEEQVRWQERQDQQRQAPARPIRQIPPPIAITSTRGGEVGKRSWLVRDFLHRGALVYLAAEAGSGKSTLLYRCAEAITEGSLFLDQLETTKGKVLVVQGDEPEADARSKFRLMGIEATFDLAYVQPPLDLTWLLEHISSKVYDAVFLDSATTLLTRDDREVTDQSFARQLYELGRAFADHHVTGLVTAHLNKPADGQIRRTVTRHDIAGVAAISAACTDLWGLWREPKPSWEDHHNLLSLGKRYCRTGTLWELQGNQEDYSWLLRQVGDGLLPQQQLTLEQRIITHLQGASRLSCVDVAAAIGSSYESTRRACTDLFAEGRLQRHKQTSGHQGRPTWLYSAEVSHG